MLPQGSLSTQDSIICVCVGVRGLRKEAGEFVFYHLQIRFTLFSVELGATTLDDVGCQET